ncbi:MAG TPA: Ig-like domain-containing protein, partial [Polyangiaceae bacterium]|nr:Ig-like domain-containing protein [Polyangiaceae bacterium]
MRTSRFSSVGRGLRPALALAFPLLVSVTVLVSCFGPPSVPVSGTLEPSAGGGPAKGKAGLSVVFAGPRGTVTDLEQPAVTVLFNHAAHDPDAADTDGLPGLSVNSEDGRPVAGAWQWIGTHGLLFTPDRPLPGSTPFVVTVAAGARALDGDLLPADYRFQFTTARPSVVRTVPDDGAADVRPDTAFRIEFNEPMDPADVEHAARVVARVHPSDPGKAIAVRGSHPSSGPQPENVVVLTPVAPLPLDSAIDVTLLKGLHGQGPLGTTSPQSLSFRTYGPLRLADLRCPRATGPRCQAHRDVTVVLTNAVDPAEFKAHFKAVDLPRRKPDAEESKKARKVVPSAEQRVAADPDFGKRYHLRITAGMRDVFGQVLDHDLVADLDTEAPFVAAGKAVSGAPSSSPQPSPASEPDDSNAPAPPPQEPSADDPRPHRARLDYELTIGLQGHVVEALARQGAKSHQVPIGAMNIPSYAMVASKLREEEALAWLDRSAKSAGDDGSVWPATQPPPAWTWVNPGSAENVRAVRTVDLDALLGGPGAHGAALLAVALPGAMGDPSSTLLTVTDLAVTAKLSRYGG